jgi:D-alanyl-D-alanine carboxypeptidase (penicillin-binding protein 5/6)
MTSFRFAARALALSLTLTATGALAVMVPATAASTAAPIPIGGPQLAARGVIVNPGPGVPPPPAMPGASFLIADMDTGQILAARAPHARHLPASTLKTLTALTLIPVYTMNSKIMVKPQDVRVDGTRLGIVAGTAYNATTLLQGLLMASGNDTAWALARGNTSVAVTLREMNAKAAYLNATDTVAKDPSGLDFAGQTSSAYDLALIGRAAMKLPDFRRYVIKKTASLPIGRSADGQRKPGFKIASHNTLLLNYPGTIGIKSGYTIAAQHTFIGAATRGGKTYIVTQMASPNGSWRPTAALLNWAFANGASVTPIGQLVDPGAAAVATATATATAKPTVAAGARTESLPATAPGDPARLAAFPPWALAAGLLSALALFGAWALRLRISRRRRHTVIHTGSQADLEPSRRTPS